jgi:hypothetical protein
MYLDKMSSPSPIQSGGVHRPVVEEIIVMSGYFILLFLVLVCVYVSRIPDSITGRFKQVQYQLLGVLAIIGITALYGYVHGILAALAFSLVLSDAMRQNGSKEGFHTCNTPSVFVDSDDSTTLITGDHKWFGEKVLGETPSAIREKPVSTSAVQDLSERAMGTGASNVSR